MMYYFTMYIFDKVLWHGSMLLHQVRIWMGVVLIGTLCIDAEISFGQTYESRKLKISRNADQTEPAPAPCNFEIKLPQERELYFVPASKADWLSADSLNFQITWPADGPDRSQIVVFLIDRDDHWFQHLPSGYLRPGAVNNYQIPLTPGSVEWQPAGHAAVWHYRVRKNPKAVGLRVFGNNAFTGTCTVAEATLQVSTGPVVAPEITNVRYPRKPITCYELFEVAFDLPDRYADPFDPKEVDVEAVFTSTNGVETKINGFYYQSFYREKDQVGERILLQGRPEWRVRFTPTIEGVHTFRLRVKDRHGEGVWSGGEFNAVPATTSGAGFIRVSSKDQRFFESDDGTFFYPIGHNTRSPFDTRMDKQFPWRFRHPEGSSAYERFFKDMRTACENIAEVWSCAWSMGLEWSSVIPGYHGAGDYRMDSAWELDRVFEWARRNQMRINFVLNNHGRVSTWCDPEWGDHPYNESCGGWLKDVNDFFSEPRAIEMQNRLNRYVVARYGWDSTIFSWVLMSELDLVGANSQRNMQHNSKVHEWHRQMARFIQANDPWKHLINTHIATDYTLQNETLAKMPELSHNALDAYHGGMPDHIVDLLQATIRHNLPFKRPVIVTEFGGSPMAAGAMHLRLELHAAIWSSAASLFAGTPFFWWWHVVEEENLYPEYTALARFMEGIDKRDPDLKMTDIRLIGTGKNQSRSGVEVIGVASPSQAIGWLWQRAAFKTQGRGDVQAISEPATIENLAVEIEGFEARPYRIEIWDTAKGIAVKRFDLRPKEGRLRFEIPPFQRDAAFKIGEVK